MGSHKKGPCLHFFQVKHFSPMVNFSLREHAFYLKKKPKSLKVFFFFPPPQFFPKNKWGVLKKGPPNARNAIESHMVKFWKEEIKEHTQKIVKKQYRPETH